MKTIKNPSDIGHEYKKVPLQDLQFSTVIPLVKKLKYLDWLVFYLISTPTYQRCS